MATQDQLNALIADIASDINGFIGASVVDVESGLPLANGIIEPAEKYSGRPRRAPATSCMSNAR